MILWLLWDQGDPEENKTGSIFLSDQFISARAIVRALQVILGDQWDPVDHLGQRYPERGKTHKGTNVMRGNMGGYFTACICIT